MSAGTPTRMTESPSSSTARRAPAIISPGAKSPPIASRAMGSVNLIDLYGDSTLVPSTVGADHVGQFGRRTLRTDAARRYGEAPVRGAAAAGLGFAGFALRDCHRSSLSPERANPSHFVGFAGFCARESESVKCSPARINRCLTVAGRLVAVDSAVRAETLAVLATEWCEWQV
jgi:hypothetical protein